MSDHLLSMSAPRQTQPDRRAVAARARHEGGDGRGPFATSSLLVPNNFSAFRHDAALFVSAVGSGTAGAITNVEGLACGRVSLSFVVPFVPGHRYYGAAPAATVSAPAGWTGGTRMGAGPWTYAYLADEPTPADSSASGTTAAVATAPDFGFTFIALTDAGSGANSQECVTVDASASIGSGTASDEA